MIRLLLIFLFAMGSFFGGTLSVCAAGLNYSPRPGGHPLINTASESTTNSNAAYAQLSSVVTQTPLGTGSLVKMDSIEAMKNFERSLHKNTVIVKHSGVYLVIIGAQVGATKTGARGFVDCWLVKNGKAVLNSTVRLTVSSSTFTGVVVSNSILSLKQGDQIGTMFTASGPALGLIYIKPDDEPAIPSFIFSVTEIAE